MRTARIARKTNETDITLTICLDGRGVSAIQSGVGFLDHMLTLLARHGRLDLELTCRGDTQVDDHHSVEDIGIALGDAVDRDGYVVRVLDLDVKRCAHRRITPFWPMSFHRTRGAPDGMTSRCYDDYCLPESSFSWRLALRLSRTA